jgi:hypothetical protein
LLLLLLLLLQALSQLHGEWEGRDRRGANHKSINRTNKSHTYIVELSSAIRRLLRRRSKLLHAHDTREGPTRPPGKKIKKMNLETGLAGTRARTDARTQ